MKTRIPACGIAIALWLSVASPAAARTIGLLIGAGAYRDTTISDLDGPRNDVAGMRAALVTRGADPSDLIILADSLPDRAEFAGPGYTIVGEPTQRTIMAQLSALATRAHAGDHVVIYYSGHGVQTRDVGEPIGPLEPDGFDEAIAPIDATRREDRSLGNLVTDDDIARAITAVRARGARVWVIFDSCHSCSALRTAGAGALPTPDARVRRIEGASAPGVITPDAGQLVDLSLSSAGGVTALYAVQSDQLAIERPFDEPDGSRPYWGVLTHAILPLLRAPRSPSFRELAIAARAGDGWRAPRIPYAEGGIDTPFLDTASARDSFAATPTQGDWSIAGGRLDGLNENDVLALFAPNDLAAEVGRLRIVRAGAVSSIAVLDGAAPAPLTHTLVARVRSRSAPAVLRVALPSTPPAQLAPVFNALTREQGGLQVTSVAEADVALAVAHDELWLIEPGASPANAPDAPRLPLTAFEGPQGAEALIAGLHRLAAARNLISIAHAQPPSSGALRVSAFVDSRRRQSGGACAVIPRADPFWSSARPASPNARLALAHCDALVLDLENTTDAPLDVTAIYIDEAGGVTPLRVDDRLVTRGGRLAPHEVRRFGFSEDLRATPRGGAGGIKSIVFIAVPGNALAEPALYDQLQQPPLYDVSSLDAFGPPRGLPQRPLPIGQGREREALGVALGVDRLRLRPIGSATHRCFDLVF